MKNTDEFFEKYSMSKFANRSDRDRQVAVDFVRLKATHDQLQEEKTSMLNSMEGLIKAHRLTESRPPQTVMQAERQLDAIESAVRVALQILKENGREV